MAPFLWTENKSGSAAVDSMTPPVVALLCASVLIFLACLTTGVVLIRRHRLRDRNQGTTAEIEAQVVQLPGPVASQSDSEEKDECVSPSPSSSSRASTAMPLLPTATAPTAPVEKPVEKLMAKTSAALSKVDKYTTLPLRRARQARQAKLAQKNPIFDFSTPLATLDAEIVSSEMNRDFGRRQPMRSTSLTVGTGTPSLSERLPSSMAIPPSNSGQSALRPSPTVLSMEVRPLEADAAALPDAEAMLVSGSLPSISSSSSAFSLADDDHTPPSEPDSDGDKRSHVGLDCETPRRSHRTNTRKGTPCSSTTSLSTMITRRDSSFSSDADTVCEVGLSGKTSLITVKESKLDDVLTFPVSVSDLSLDLSSDKGGDIVCSRPHSGADDLSSLTKYSRDAKLEECDLTTLALADTSF